MNEKNVRWTGFNCDECNGFVLYDAVHDTFFCENCGLVLEYRQLWNKSDSMTL